MLIRIGDAHLVKPEITHEITILHLFFKLEVGINLHGLLRFAKPTVNVTASVLTGVPLGDLIAKISDLGFSSLALRLALLACAELFHGLIFAQCFGFKQLIIGIHRGDDAVEVVGVFAVLLREQTKRALVFVVFLLQGIVVTKSILDCRGDLVAVNALKFIGLYQLLKALLGGLCLCLGVGGCSTCATLCGRGCFCFFVGSDATLGTDKFGRLCTCNTIRHAVFLLHLGKEDVILAYTGCGFPRFGRAFACCSAISTLFAEELEI